MAFQVTGANSRRTRVEFALPVDINGEPAFDENDHPIKGVTPVTFTLPRYNFISLDELKELLKAGAEIEKRELSDDYTIMDRGREAALSQLRPFVTDEIYTLLAGLTMGELQQINDEWTRSSNVPLGESSASNGSSTSTRRPSKQTSATTTVSASAT